MSDRESITIDGSQGEGGGQIVRTALTLACVTGRPLRVVNVRAGRPKPGLGHQHLAAIRAVQRICAAEVRGDHLSSRMFSFAPGEVQPGTYRFDVGTAGSTALVLQTIALPLALSSGHSQVTITGGTHNPMAPCYEYLKLVWAPLLALLNVHVELEIQRAGFYPPGGGRIEARIAGISSADRLAARSILERDKTETIEGFSAVAQLPRSIAQRQARQAARRLKAAGISHNPIDVRSIEASSPGTVLFLHCRSPNSPAAFFALGARGKPAEHVADEAADQMITYLRQPGALDPHAADQLVLPLALTPATSRFTTTQVTDHLVTHIDLLGQFLNRPIRLLGSHGQPGTVTIAAG